MVAREPGAIVLPLLVALCAAAPFFPILAHPAEVIASPNSNILSQDLGLDGFVTEGLVRRGRTPS